MGAFKSSLVISNKEKIKNIKPSNPKWVFKHAENVQVPFVEVNIYIHINIWWYKI